MSRIVLRVLLTLLLALALSTEARAQFVANPGTGCAGPLTWAGTPTIGTTPIMHSPCPPGTLCVLIIGTPIPCFNVPPLCPGCDLCCSLTVTIPFVAAGEWKIEVKGFKLKVGEKQSFALAVTGLK